MANYEIWATNPDGLRLGTLSRVLWMNASWEANVAGWLDLGLPIDTNRALIQEDHAIQVWRAPPGTRLGFWDAFFISKITETTTPDGEFLVVEGPNMMDILDRRIVVGFAEEPENVKTGPADDMMKEIVREQFGAGADSIAPTPDAGTRVQVGLTVAPDIGAGPTITKQFAWADVLTPSAGGILTAIARASEIDGPRVYFDIATANVTSTSVDFEFRTNVNQPGRDLTDRVIFDQERGNLRDAKIETDYSQSFNYVYAGGSGDMSAREIQQVWDAVRFSASRWARRERFAEDTRLDLPDAVRELGRAALDSGRPRQRFTGTPIDTGGTVAGRDWDKGDRIRRRYRGVEQDSVVAAMTLSLQRGTGIELISTRLDDV